MRVTLDLTKLLEEGKITQAEFDRLSEFAAGGTASLAFNILIGFAVIAVSGGLLALLQDPATSVIVGLVVLGSGLALYGVRWKQWEILAHICVLAGALIVAGGLVILGKASILGFLVIAIGFAVAGTVARSGLLIVGAVLALASCLGARTDYMDATYLLGMKEPTLTIVVFGLVAVGSYQASKQLPSEYARLALIGARTSVFLINFGFWIGSLWGDQLDERFNLIIDDSVFVIAWAVALIGAGAWAAWANRSWLVNVVAVFAAIHFYTQWFERLGADPITILLAGLLGLTIALGLWRFNRQLWDRPGSPKPA